MIGKTPLLDLTHLMSKPNKHGKKIQVLGKAEFLNPGLSHKDIKWVRSNKGVFPIISTNLGCF